MSKVKNKNPTFDQMINPLFVALKLLGGLATIDESYEKVIELMKFRCN